MNEYIVPIVGTLIYLVIITCYRANVTVIRKNSTKRYCSEIRKNKIKGYSYDSRNFDIFGYSYAQEGVDT